MTEMAPPKDDRTTAALTAFSADASSDAKFVPLTSVLQQFGVPSHVRCVVPIWQVSGAGQSAVVVQVQTPPTGSPGNSSAHVVLDVHWFGWPTS